MLLPTLKQIIYETVKQFLNYSNNSMKTKTDNPIHVQNAGRVKLWRIDHFRVQARENVGKFTIAYIATLVNLEFGGVKYWRMVFDSSNSPEFPLPKFYTIQ